MGNPVHAQTSRCQAEPCIQQHPSAGTHFLTELNGGMLLHGGGATAQALIGVGGKLRRFPLRFYFIGEVAYDSIDQTDRGIAGYLVQDHRSSLDLTAGLRIYWPIFRPLRWFIDGLGGASRVDAALHRQGFSSLYSTDFHAAGVLATGLQFRVLHHLSLGLRLRLVFVEDGLAEARQLENGSSSMRTALTGGLSWHF